MLSTNCMNCIFNSDDECTAVVGANFYNSRNCTFKKTSVEYKESELKTCKRLSELANAISGRAKLYDIFIKYDSTVSLMKRNGYSSVVSLVFNT